MIKKSLIFLSCLAVLFVYAMKEEDIDQNNNNNNNNMDYNQFIDQNKQEDKEKSIKLLIDFANSKETKTVKVLYFVAKKIPMIRFLPQDQSLKIEFTEKIFKNIINIVKSCEFENEDKRIKKAIDYFKENSNPKPTPKFKDLKGDAVSKISFGKDTFSKKKFDLEKNFNNESESKKTITLNKNIEITPNKNIEIIKKIFEQEPLVDRIETLLLANDLKLPSALIDDIIYGLNIKITTFEDLEKLQKYSKNSYLCKILKNKRIFFEENHSAKKLKLSFKPGGSYFIQFDPKEKKIVLALNGSSINVWDYENKKVDTIEIHKNSTPLNLIFVQGDPNVLVKIRKHKNWVYVSNLKEKTKTILIEPKSEELCSNNSSMALDQDGGFLYTIQAPRIPGNGSFIKCNINKDAIELITEKNKLDTSGNIKEGFSLIEYINSNKTKRNIVVATNFRLFFYDKNNNSIRVDTEQRGISALKFNEKSQLLASASKDGIINLWDILVYKKICSLIGHSNSITDIAFSPNGKILVSVSLDKTMKFRNTDTGCCFRTLSYDDGLMSVAFNNDGTLICTVTEKGNVHLLSLDCAEELSLEQIIFLIYLQEKNNSPDEKYKEIYNSLPNSIKKKLNISTWNTTEKKQDNSDKLSLFPFEKRNKK